VDAFSYLSVILSIVLGLGMTQILTAFGRLIRHRDRVEEDWLPILWAVSMLVIFVQVWWSMFGLRTRRDWTFLEFTIVLAQTATLYVMAAVALPEDVPEGGISLRAYYERHHRWFFAWFLATLVISVSKDLVLGGQLPGAFNLASHVVLATGCVLGMLIRRYLYHQFLGIAFAIVIATYIGLLFTRLQ
jgi:hypothetical protein